MKKILFLIITLPFFLLNCSEEANDPIVVSQPIDEDPEIVSNPSKNCVFVEANATFLECVINTTEDTFEVITWNIERFPINGASTLADVEEIIRNTNADLIAVQEIISISEFEAIANDLVDWEAHIVDIGGSLNMGFLYKTCEISEFTTPTSLSIIEPRPAVITTATHNNGLSITFFNIHLKCCGGSDNYNRRLNASNALKNYIDSNLATSNVIVLGDFNDDINSGSPFENFSSDVADYAFADQEIANGSSANWSYPSYPSHIDHILISNELFDNLLFTETLKLSPCVTGYSYNVSDHRPIFASFQKD